MLKVLSDKAKIILIFAFVVGTIVILTTKVKAEQYNNLSINSVEIQKIENGNVVMLEDSKAGWQFVVLNDFSNAKTVYYYISLKPCGIEEVMGCKKVQVLKSEDLKTWK